MLLYDAQTFPTHFAGRKVAFTSHSIEGLLVYTSVCRTRLPAKPRETCCAPDETSTHETTCSGVPVRERQHISRLTSTDKQAILGEAAAAGRAGGMNLGFYADLTSMTDSGVVLMDARKGEKDEHVNFTVQPSPWYKGAWRFEASCRPGWFLCFQPPTHLRMVSDF